MTATTLHDQPLASGAAEVDELLLAGRVLAYAGLVTAFGHVSTRSSPTSFRITPPAPLGYLASGAGITVELESDTLPAGAPGEAWIHLEVYRQRQDVQAVARAQPPDAIALSVIDTEHLPMHGQGALLGSRVPIFDDARLVRSPPPAAALAAVLGPQNALLLRGNGAVTVGSTLGRAVARMWVLERSAEVALAAAGRGTPLNVSEVTAWQDAGEEILDRIWAWLCTETETRHPKPAPPTSKNAGHAPMP